MEHEPLNPCYLFVFHYNNFNYEYIKNESKSILKDQLALFLKILHSHLYIYAFHQNLINMHSHLWTFNSIVISDHQEVK